MAILTRLTILSALWCAWQHVHGETLPWLTQFNSHGEPRPRNDGARHGRCDREGEYPIFSATAGAHQDPRFVTVEGTKLKLGCRTLKFGGSNTYQLMERGMDGSEGQARVRTLLDEHVKLGMEVVRTWTFAYYWDKALQWAGGSYNEDAFRALDYAIDEAGKRNLKLIVALGDMWCEPEGVSTMIGWCGGSWEGDFFTLESCKDMYKDRISSIVERVNTITGVAYKDDPTIMAWDIINEARYKFGGHCNLRNWFGEMAAYIKSLDNKHLVTTGEEAFYSTTPDGYWVNPDYWSPDEGQDFIADHTISQDIDFLVIHMWPDNWLQDSVGWEDKVRFTKDWVDVHIAQAAELGMPLVIEEFGKEIRNNENVEIRNAIYRAVYDAAEESAKNGGPVVGTMFWYLSDEVYSDPDGWSRGGYHVALSDQSTLGLIERHSRSMANAGDSQSSC